jgi:hypothetical protein
MDFYSASHTTIENTSQFFRNAVESHFIQDSNRLPVKLYINFVLLCGRVTNF